MRSIIAPPVLIIVFPAILGSRAIWICHSLSEAITAYVAFSMLIASNRRTKINDV
jgi:Na+-driven multidrug efflux pump